MLQFGRFLVRLQHAWAGDRRNRKVALRLMSRRMNDKPIKLAFIPGQDLLHSVNNIDPGVGRRRNRIAEMAMRLRIEELRLQHARLVADEKDKDRELARYTIDERRRLAMDIAERAELAREAAQDAEDQANLAATLARTQSRLANGDELRSERTEQAKEPMSEEEKRIADEIAQVMAGTWTGPDQR